MVMPAEGMGMPAEGMGAVIVIGTGGTHEGLLSTTSTTGGGV
jgi:hypothetical protein